MQNGSRFLQQKITSRLRRSFATIRPNVPRMIPISSMYWTVDWGRDFPDVSPLTGASPGSGQQKLTVSHDVMKLETDARSEPDLPEGGCKGHPVGRCRLLSTTHPEHPAETVGRQIHGREDFGGPSPAAAG